MSQIIVGARAPSNIAIVKYMGKRDGATNIPENPSLSLTMNRLCSYVEITCSDALDSDEAVWAPEPPLLWGGYNDLKLRVPSLDEEGIGRFLRHFKLVREAAPAILSKGAARQSAGGRKIEDRFVELFDELRLPIYRYLAQAGLRTEETEEIAQEVFLRRFKHLLEQRREENLRGWVFRVAHNLAFDRRRDRNRLMTKSLEEWARLSDLLIDTAQYPGQALFEKERTAGIDRAIRSLPQRQWQCLSLRLKGFGYREIGEILGIRVSTVAESLRHAIEKLQGNETKRPLRGREQISVSRRRRRSG